MVKKMILVILSLISVTGWAYLINKHGFAETFIIFCLCLVIELGVAYTLASIKKG